MIRIELTTGEDVQIIQIAMKLAKLHIFRNPGSDSANDLRLCDAADSIIEQVQNALSEPLGEYFEAEGCGSLCVRVD